MRRPDATVLRSAAGGAGGGGAIRVREEFKPVPMSGPDRAILRGPQGGCRGQLDRLEKATGLPQPDHLVIEAPWRGRGRYTGSTSEGWARNNREFWRAVRRFFPDDADLLRLPEMEERMERSPIVTLAFARMYGWLAYRGQVIVHHHLENGPFVVPLPCGAHSDRLAPGRSGPAAPPLHRRPKVEGRP